MKTYKKGDIVIHKVFNFQMLILDDSKYSDGIYKARIWNGSEIDVRDFEIK